MHNDPQNDVKFRTQKMIFLKIKKYRRMSATEDVPVSDPSDRAQCPEAFEGHVLLRHMRRGNNFHAYADLLGYQDPRFFKNDIDKVLGRIAGRRNPSMTWAILFDTLFHMKNLLLTARAGLECDDKFSLVAKINTGIEELEDITEKANQAQELSHVQTTNNVYVFVVP